MAMYQLEYSLISGRCWRFAYVRICAVRCAGQVNFPTVEPWRVNEDTQAKIPLVLSGFEGSANISVRIAAKYGRLLVLGSDGDGNDEFISGLGESLTLPGTQDEINAALESVWYSAPLDWNSLGQNTFETISVVVDEQESASGGDPYPGVPRTLIVMVAAVNDPPSLQGPSEIIATESLTTTIDRIEVSDPDGQDTVGGFIVEVTVSVAEAGSILKVGSSLGLYMRESSDESKIFQGSLENVNIALASLTFRGPLEFSGTTELKVDVNDMGNTGEGGSMSASLLMPIYVSSVNNPPRVTREQGLILRGFEDEPIQVDGIVVEDQDAGDGRVRLTIEALYGAVSFGYEHSELEFERGDGLLDEGVTVLGTIEVRYSFSINGYDQMIPVPIKFKIRLLGMRCSPEQRLAGHQSTLSNATLAKK